MRPKLRLQRDDPPQPRRAVSTVTVPKEQWIYILVPALVSEELFEAVQVQLEENRRRARQRQRGARYLLQGLLVCAQCQYAYYGKPVSQKSAKGKQRDYAYYRCIGTDAYRFGGERICDNLQVRTDLLDELVWNEVCDLLAEPQRLEQEYQRRLNTPSRENEDLLTTQAQLAKVRQGIARLIDSYSEGFIEKQEFEPRIQRLRQRLSSFEDRERQIRLELARQAELRLVIARLEDFAVKVKDGLAEADWLTKRELIRTLVKRVEIGKEEVNVVFRVIPDPFDSSPDRGSLQHCWRGDNSFSHHISGNHPALRHVAGSLQVEPHGSCARVEDAGVLLSRSPRSLGAPGNQCRLSGCARCTAEESGLVRGFRPRTFCR